MFPPFIISLFIYYTNIVKIFSWNLCPECLWGISIFYSTDTSKPLSSKLNNPIQPHKHEWWWWIANNYINLPWNLVIIPAPSSHCPYDFSTMTLVDSLFMIISIIISQFKSYHLSLRLFDSVPSPWAQFPTANQKFIQHSEQIFWIVT